MTSLVWENISFIKRCKSLTPSLRSSHAGLNIPPGSTLEHPTLPVPGALAAPAGLGRPGWEHRSERVHVSIGCSLLVAKNCPPTLNAQQFTPTCLRWRATTMSAWTCSLAVPLARSLAPGSAFKGMLSLFQASGTQPGLLLSFYALCFLSYCTASPATACHLGV